MNTDRLKQALDLVGWPILQELEKRTARLEHDSHHGYSCRYGPRENFTNRLRFPGRVALCIIEHHFDKKLWEDRGAEVSHMTDEERSKQWRWDQERDGELFWASPFETRIEAQIDAVLALYGKEEDADD